MLAWGAILTGLALIFFVLTLLALAAVVTGIGLVSWGLHLRNIKGRRDAAPVGLMVLGVVIQTWWLVALAALLIGRWLLLQT